VAAAGAVLLAGCGDPGPVTPTATSSSPGPATATLTDPVTVPAETVPLDLAALEAELDLRIGLVAVDTGSGRTVEHRADERFAHASTFKVLVAAAVLEGSTAAELDEVVLPVTQDDLVHHSPVATTRVGDGMTLRELGDAAVRVSDNAATNLLLEHVGGPPGLQAAVRAFGDSTTRLDRWEPEMSEAVPGDERDTSTPRALAADLRLLVVDDGLEPEDRTVLDGWLRSSETGAGLVRAAVPDGWEVASKSGTGGYGNRNDVAVVRPPGRSPIVVAVLTRQDEPDDEPSDEAVARAAAAALAELDR